MTDLPKAKPEPTRRLFESERAFRLLVEGVIDYAISMVSPEGIITTWNAGAERIKGYNADEAVGRHIRIFYSSDDVSLGIPDRALEVARREGRYSSEGWRLRKDGTRFLASVVIDAIYEHGALIGFAKITRDVSEREAAFGALMDSERNFRTLVRGVTDYALYMLDVNGNVSSWTAAASGSRDTLRRKLLVSISLASTPSQTASMGSPRERSPLRSRKALTRKRDFACAKTARSSSPVSSSIRFTTTMAN